MLAIRTRGKQRTIKISAKDATVLSIAGALAQARKEIERECGNEARVKEMIAAAERGDLATVKKLARRK